MFVLFRTAITSIPLRVNNIELYETEIKIDSIPEDMGCNLSIHYVIPFSIRRSIGADAAVSKNFVANGIASAVDCFYRRTVCRFDHPADFCCGI